MGLGLVGYGALGRSGGYDLVGSGLGFGVRAGARIGSVLALEGAYESTSHRVGQDAEVLGEGTDGVVLSSFTGDAKIRFPLTIASVTPFVQAGVGLYLLDNGYFGAAAIGSGFQGGAGFDLELDPGFDLGVCVLYRGIAFGPPDESEEDSFLSLLSAGINLALRFE